MPQVHVVGCALSHKCLDNYLGWDSHLHKSHAHFQLTNSTVLPTLHVRPSVAESVPIHRMDEPSITVNRRGWVAKLLGYEGRRP